MGTRLQNAEAKLAAALAQHGKAVDALYRTAESYALAGAAQYSREHPRRRVTWYSGMGAAFLAVEKHGGNRNGRDEYFVSHAGDNLRGVQIPEPAFMTRIAEVESETGLNGLGDGTKAKSFLNGKAAA